MINKKKREKKDYSHEGLCSHNIRPEKQRHSRHRLTDCTRTGTATGTPILDTV